MATNRKPSKKLTDIMCLLPIGNDYFHEFYFGDFFDPDVATELTIIPDDLKSLTHSSQFSPSLLAKHKGNIIWPARITKHKPEGSDHRPCEFTQIRKQLAAIMATHVQAESDYYNLLRSCMAAHGMASALSASDAENEREQQCLSLGN